MHTKTFLFFSIILLILAGSPVWGSGDDHPGDGDGPRLADLEFERLAVMPFLTGRLESPDNLAEKPLSQSLPEVNRSAYTLADNAEQIMTRLVHDFLEGRYRGRILPQQTSVDGYTGIHQAASADTVRKRATRFGAAVRADLVMVGTVWRFREKGADRESPNSQASVGFAVYLVDVASGKRLWRSAFDGSQKVLSDDLLGGLRQVKLSTRWLSATELARLGVKQAFKRFPLQ